eukprot:934160-Amphidinium_carterae.2
MNELGGDTDWDQVLFMDAGCALHDCHNALKWSFESICAGATDTLKRLHIGINAQPVSVLMELYEAFGMESSLLALVCEEIRLYWCVETSQLQILDTFIMVHVKMVT